MGLSSAGIGSNLPVDSIISQLMGVEQKPLTALDKKVAAVQAKLSAMGTIKSALATFQTAVKGLSDVSKFQAVSATIGDAAVATVSGSPTATLGSYSLEVSRLAQAQKLASAGQASSSADIGTGTITFDLGTITGGSLDAVSGKYTGAGFNSSGSVKTVTIGAGDSSLSGIRDAINKAQVGVTASIVNDGSGTPYRLVLTEQASGKASSMKITVGGGDPELAALLNHDPDVDGGQAMSEMVTAQNAEFKLDGIAISSASNTASNVIDGLTLKLTKTNVGNPTSVVLARDSAAVTASVGQFVSAYNAINKTMKDLTAYNESTKVGAVLNGDSTVRGIQTQLRALLSSPVATGGSAFSVLSEIGVTVKAGVMSIDDAKLKSTIDSNFTDVAGLFAAVGRPSDSLVAFNSATAKTMPGSYAVQVSQAAARGSIAASAPAGLVITGSNNTLSVVLDGVTSTVTLGVADYTADSAALAAEVQSKINGTAAFASVGASVSVTMTGGKLSITSNRYGPNSGVGVSGAGSANLLGATPTALAGADVVGTIGGFAATGSGRTLTAVAGNPTEGLSLLVDGSGSRGTVNYSQGYAYQFDRFATALLDTTGALTSRTDGLSASIKSLADNRLRLTDRLAETEKRYRAQYTTLDATLSRMSSTSSYLTQQLAQIANLN